MTAPTVGQIREALHVVGTAACGLGVEVDPRLLGWTTRDWAEAGHFAGVAWYHLGPLAPLDDRNRPALTHLEALGWTALAAWIEGGVRPIEVQRWPRFVEYRVRLAGRVASSGAARFGTALAGIAELAAGGDADAAELEAANRGAHRDAGELALALAVLRRWVAPSRPWGLRDMIAEHLERVGREAAARAAGRGSKQLFDPIPPGYLAAFGTADE